MAGAEDLWLRARPLMRERLETEAASLKEFVESVPPPRLIPTQEKLV